MSVRVAELLHNSHQAKKGAYTCTFFHVYSILHILNQPLNILEAGEKYEAIIMEKYCSILTILDNIYNDSQKNP